MYRIYEDTKYQDISFKSDDGTITKAHRVVLANSNVEWFKTLLNSSFKDAKDKVIEVHDVESIILEIAIKYAYRIEPSYLDLDFDKMFRIFKAADYFSCNELIKNLKEEVCRPNLGGYNQTLVFKYIDCLIHFDNISIVINDLNDLNFKINIFELNGYFREKYQDDINMQKAWSLCELDETSIIDFLSDDGIIENINLVGSRTLLKKIDYVKEWKSNPDISILMRFAKRGLVFYPEIIHLITYASPYVIEKFPLKVGHLICSTDYNDKNKYGTFVGKLINNSLRVSDEEIGTEVSKYISYIFYEEN